MQIAPVTLSNVHPACLRTAFWEAGADVADPAMEKELWLSNTLMTYGTCGFSAVASSPAATILFAPPALLPGAARMPSGPISPDATLISSMFCSAIDSCDDGLKAVLIDACLSHLLGQEVLAVEAFGWRSGATYGPIGLIPETAFLKAGFEVVTEHDEVPRLRLELPPTDGLLAAAEIEALLKVSVGG